MTPTRRSLVTLISGLALLAPGCAPPVVIMAGGAASPMTATAPTTGAPAGTAPNTPEGGRTITVVGQATVEVVPDCLDVSFVLTAEAVRPSDAVSEVQRKQAALREGLDKLKLDGKDLKFAAARLAPVYAERGNERRIRGYQAEIRVTATTRDFTKLAGLVEAGANAGVGELMTQFRRSDLPVLKRKARDLALAAAKDKAAQMTDALGIQLGGAVGVTEGDSSSWDGAWSSSSYSVSNTYVVQPGRASDGPSVESTSLTQMVTVTYVVR